MALPYTAVLKTLSDPVCGNAVRLLLGGPATQKQIVAALGLSSGSVSRRMGVLEGLGIVERERSHGPYSLTFPTETRALQQMAADLADQAAERRAARARRDAREMRKDSLSGGHLRDREGGA